MKIAVLSRGPDLYSTRRLKEAARRRDHGIKVLDTLSLSMMVSETGPALFYNSKRLGHYDAVIPRIGASITFYGTAVIRQFEQMGVFTLNSSHAISVSRDKLRSSQILSRHKIGMPPTVFVRSKEGVMDAIERVGGVPIIVKLLEGTQGVGVILVESAGTAKAIIETLHMARQNVLIQKFVEESRGRDIRAFVVGGRVVAAMRRVGKGGEFRSNVHQGGRVEPVQLDPAYEETAIRAAQILGLQVAGVDMLEGNDGPKVMEVNSSPGLEGIEKATGVDVADAVIAHLEERVLFPEVDLRQRLTLKAGYGIAEVPVRPTSELARKTIREAALRRREMLVLSIQRGSITIASPTSEEQILPGDILLCYGKLLTLKTLLPPKPARANRKRASPSRGEAARGKGAAQPPEEPTTQSTTQPTTQPVGPLPPESSS